MARINIIAPSSSFGYMADILIVQEALRWEGHTIDVEKVHLFDSKLTRLWAMLKSKLRRPFRHDLNIFIGPVFKEWVPLARRNVIIPNAEWFLESWVSFVQKFDLVAAKNVQAFDAFKSLGCKVALTGFATPDARKTVVRKNFDKYLHVSSNGGKGTARLLDTWSKHPEWPPITVVSNRPDIISGQTALARGRNINLISEYLPLERIRQLQDEHGIHICCSEAEGFGHYIVEAMSTGAVVVTTDGAPMNELIQPDRGLLLAVSDSESMNLSKRYFFDPASLAAAVTRLSGMREAEKAQLGANARRWYEVNQQKFGPLFREELRKLLA